MTSEVIYQPSSPFPSRLVLSERLFVRLCERHIFVPAASFQPVDKTTLQLCCGDTHVSWRQVVIFREADPVLGSGSGSDDGHNSSTEEYTTIQANIQPPERPCRSLLTARIRRGIQREDLRIFKEEKKKNRKQTSTAARGPFLFVVCIRPPCVTVVYRVAVRSVATSREFSRKFSHNFFRKNRNRRRLTSLILKILATERGRSNFGPESGDTDLDHPSPRAAVKWPKRTGHAEMEKH